MTLIEKVVYNSLLYLQATNYWRKTPVAGFSRDFVRPVKANRILLFAKYFEKMTYQAYLHLSIHEIRSDHRVGHALWSFNGSVDGHFDNNDLDATILVETRQAHTRA